MIPEHSQGAQAWDRYAYVNNNPVKSTDPTGHVREEGDGETSESNESNGKLCNWLPKVCEGGSSNPFTYDTVGLQGEFDFKLGGGIEIKPFIIINGDDLRNLDFKNIEGAFGVSFEVTVGISAEVAGGLTVTGSDGSVLAQDGLQPPSGNLGACMFSGCGKASASYSLAEQKVTQIAYTVGAGEGFDVSGGQAVNSLIIYGDNNQGWLKIPFFPVHFPLNFSSPIQ
jgi:hypothetical protein